MKTPTCEAADNPAVALTDAARGALHRRCSCAYLTTDGEQRYCDCDCHRSGTAKAHAGPLPVLEVPSGAVGRGGALEGEKGPEKASKRPSGAGPVPCQCGCGTKVPGRFAPGHDAKLKSRLVQEAEGGNASAAAELYQRRWMKLVKADRIPEPTLRRGEQLAQQDRELTYRRTTRRTR